ncbi:MAG TPA: acyl-CoA dehydrogenase family protein [Solirubrobacteraceae bacterium]|nr:acyl-CoA dehydrogenase family protein [Solirubrobacteraceae bacterium]
MSPSTRTRHRGAGHRRRSRLRRGGADLPQRPRRGQPGIARAALSAVIAHAQSRRYPDGTTLVEVPTVQHALANMDMDTRAAAALLCEAAEVADAGDEGALVPLMEATVLCTDVAARVTHGALEVCGGQGYTPALPIERHLRDARAGAVMAPTNGVLRTWSGKAISGLPVP